VRSGDVSPVEPYASLRWPTGIAGSDAKAKLAEGVADRVEHLLSSAGAAPRVGLGSGTTSFLTLLALARRRDRLPPGLVLCATSHEMEWYATAAGMAVEPLAGGRVTVAFDGADQVDPAGALIKGRGGAMQRERRTQQRCHAAFRRTEVAQPNGMQVQRHPGRRGAFRLLHMAARGGIARGSHELHGDR